MGILVVLVMLVVGGLIVGGLARLALPGPDPMSIPMTIGLGIAGSLVGGLVARIFLGTGGGLIFAVLGAMLVLYLHRRFVQKRPLTGPQARQRP
ncbi:MAG TPA: GlsB/YeaQ/YmgE family stress response membrane protein [Gaiellaceae bacterium]|nr:GlsB/YeaQ/YmgE family stress response membrane protein [Gaiellaceae bacterium]